MSSVFCNCTLTSGVRANTGITPNAKIFGEMEGVLVVRQKADDGTDNVISISDFVSGVLPQAYIDGKLHHTDPSKRWYWIPFETVESTREAPNTFQQGVGNNRVLSKGNRPFLGTLYKPQETFLRNLDKLGNCGTNLAFFGVDQCGSIGGQVKEGATEMKPIKIGDRTWNIEEVPATEAQSAQITVAFEYDRKYSDADFDMIPSGAVTATEGYLLDEAESLENVLVGLDVTSTTEATITLSLEAGNFDNTGNLPATGWDSADLEIYNQTTETTVALTSLTETGSTGVYTAVFTAQTSADVLELRQTSSANLYTKDLYEIEQGVTDVVP